GRGSGGGEGAERAEKDERRGGHRGRRIFADMPLDLEHLAVQRRAEGALLDLGLGRWHLRFCRGSLRRGLLELGLRRFHRRSAASGLLDADGPAVESFRKIEASLHVIEARPSDANRAALSRKIAASDGEIR